VKILNFKNKTAISVAELLS